MQLQQRQLRFLPRFLLSGALRLELLAYTRQLLPGLVNAAGIKAGNQPPPIGHIGLTAEQIGFEFQIEIGIEQARHGSQQSLGDRSREGIGRRLALQQSPNGHDAPFTGSVQQLLIALHQPISTELE